MAVFKCSHWRSLSSPACVCEKQFSGYSWVIHSKLHFGKGRFRGEGMLSSDHWQKIKSLARYVQFSFWPSGSQHLLRNRLRRNWGQIPAHVCAGGCVAFVRGVIGQSYWRNGGVGSTVLITPLSYFSNGKIDRWATSKHLKMTYCALKMVTSTPPKIKVNPSLSLPPKWKITLMYLTDWLISV